jgi:cellulose synthase/poly-beta-1,6-N-acetylglucosamine synthase-like glycosyltransferase
MSIDETSRENAGVQAQPPESTCGGDDVVARDALDWSVNGLHRMRPALSARRRFSTRQVVGLVIALLVITAGFALAPILTGRIAMSALIVIYTGVLLFRIDLAVRGGGSGRFEFDADEVRSIPDAELPSYTVLVPAYKEPEVVPQLVGHLAALEYPPSKLEIRLLLEADDVETVEAARAMNLQEPFSIVLVPPSEPRTKPKALNFALLDSPGEIVTIYDAEDRPDPLQLRKVAATFAQCGPEVACVQAELAYFNADENLITRWFATEYRAWFTQFLPQLSKVDAPIPLGGTSNHIRRDLLVRLGAWDPFNVTEDADLGIRLRRQGFRVAVLDSVTYEEANTDFVNWIKQRSRWYKGYLQTWLVHMRHPVALFRDLGLAGFVRFNLFVGGTPLLAALNPVSWALLVMWFTLQPQFIIDIMPAPVYYAGLAGWLFGNFALYYVNLVLASEYGRRSIFRAALQLPLYWVMMSIAALKALFQLIVNPNYWEKTQHGLSKVDSASVSHAGVPTAPAPDAPLGAS